MKVMTGTAAALAMLVVGGAGTALADHGHGRDGDRGRDDRGAQGAPGSRATPPCAKPKDVVVGYVFRGTVAGTTADSVTVNLLGANAHARRALLRATPPVVISSAATDLLLVPTPAGTVVTRNGATGMPLLGDAVTVKYRAPHSRKVGKRCVAGGTAAVTVTNGVATFAGTGVTLKRVSATGPVTP